MSDSETDPSFEYYSEEEDQSFTDEDSSDTDSSELPAGEISNDTTFLIKESACLSHNDTFQINEVKTQKPDIHQMVEELKSLDISGKPKAGKVPNVSSLKQNNKDVLTPIKSGSVPKTKSDVYESPYNTRLKARLLREKQQRMRSTGSPNAS